MNDQNGVKLQEQFDILHAKIGSSLISTQYQKVMQPLYILFNNSVTKDRMSGYFVLVITVCNVYSKE